VVVAAEMDFCESTPGCPLVGAGCTRLCWSMTAGADWPSLRSVSSASAMRLEHIVRNFDAMTQTHGVAASPWTIRDNAASRRAARFHVNAFYPWQYTLYSLTPSSHPNSRPTILANSSSILTIASRQRGEQREEVMGGSERHEPAAPRTAGGAHVACSDGAAAGYRLALGARGGSRPTPSGQEGFGGRRRPETPQPAGGENLACGGRRRRGRPPPRSWRRGGCGPVPTEDEGDGGHRRLGAPRDTCGEQFAWVGRRRRGRPPPLSWHRGGRKNHADGARGLWRPPTTRGTAASRRRALGVGGEAALRPTTASILASEGLRDLCRPGTRAAASTDDSRRQDMSSERNLRGSSGGAAADHRLALGAMGAGAVATGEWGSRDKDVSGGGLRCRAAPRWSFRARRRARGVGDAGGGGRQRPAVSGPLRAARPRGERVAPR